MDKTFRLAAEKALVEWGREGGVDDLVQDLWVWYLESPGTQAKFADQDEFLTRRLAYKASLQILAKQSLAADVFDNKVLYSSDSVREALHGLSSNKYLQEILPVALGILEARNPGQAEALRSRYTDGIVPPREGGEAMLLSRAVKSLTDEVNVLYLTADKRGRHAVFPGARRATGGHSDPTGDVAMALIDHGDNPIDVLDRDGSTVIGTTTYRKEFFS